MSNFTFRQSNTSEINNLVIFQPVINSNFVFTQSFTQDSKFIFGISDNQYNGTIDYTLEAVLGVIQANVSDYVGNVLFTLDGCSGVIQGEYDSNVTRFKLNKTCSNQEDSTSDYYKINVDYQQDISNIVKHCITQDDGNLLVNKLESIRIDALKLDNSYCSEQEDSNLLLYKLNSIIEILDLIDNSECGLTNDSILEFNKVCAEYGIIELLRVIKCSHVNDADKLPINDVHALFDTINLQLNKLCSNVEDAKDEPFGVSPWIDIPREDFEDPIGHTNYTIPIQDTYLMQHSISVTTVTSQTLNVDNINISMDTDSHTYSMSFILLDPSEKSYVTQVGNTPIELLITVNGIDFKMIVDSIINTVVFGKKSIQVRGRGLTALLSQPFTSPYSQVQNSLLTVQQIADLQMPIGWSINWNFDVWNIPADTYSHTNLTNIQALFQICQKIGAIVVPDTVNQVINVEPRYKVLPWDFSTATPDVSIPFDAVTEYTEQPESPSDINGVYVHGEEGGGQLGFCRLNGTAGDILAPTVTNALMTDPTALRKVGEKVLADNAVQPTIKNFKMPMDNNVFPLLQVGDFIEIGGVRGIVNSVSLDAGFSQVYQSVQLGKETANNWSLFTSILPSDPLLVGTANSVSGNTTLITLYGGGVIRVRGIGVPGNNYYIQSGELKGLAPSLTQTEIVI